MLEGVIPPETFPPCGVALSRTCRCTELHRVKNANLRHPSAVMCQNPLVKGLATVLTAQMLQIPKNNSHRARWFNRSKKNINSTLYTPRRRRGSRGIAPLILNLDTIVSGFTLRPFYRRWKSHRYPQDKKLMSPEVDPDVFGKQIQFLVPTRIEPGIVLYDRQPSNCTLQINHQPAAIIFQFIILMFIYSSTCFGRFPRPSSGAQWLQWQPLVLTRLSPRYEGKTRGCHCSHWVPDDGRGKRPKHVEL